MQITSILQFYNINKLLEQKLNHLLAPEHLTLRLLQVLILIHNQNDDLETIQSYLQTNKSTLSRQLNQLLHNQLITYTISSDNHRRSYTLTLTGLQQFNIGSKLVESYLQQLFKYWSEDEQRLFNLLTDHLYKDLQKRSIH